MGIRRKQHKGFCSCCYARDYDSPEMRRYWGKWHRRNDKTDIESQVTEILDQRVLPWVWVDEPAPAITNEEEALLERIFGERV